MRSWCIGIDIIVVFWLWFLQQTLVDGSHSILSQVVNSSIVDPNFVCGELVSVRYPWSVGNCTTPPCFANYSAKVVFLTIDNPSDELKASTHMTYWAATRHVGGGPCFLGELEIPCGVWLNATSSRQAQYAVCVWDGKWHMGTGSSSAFIVTRNTTTMVEDAMGCKLLPKTSGTFFQLDMNMSTCDGASSSPGITHSSAPVIYSSTINRSVADPNFMCPPSVSVRYPWSVDGCSRPPCFVAYPTTLAVVTITNPSGELARPTHLSYGAAVRSKGAGPCYMGETKIPCGVWFDATTLPSMQYVVCMWDGGWVMGTGSSSAAIRTKNTSTLIETVGGCNLYPKTAGTLHRIDLKNVACDREKRWLRR